MKFSVSVFAKIGVKSSAVAPMQRAATPTVDGSQSALSKSDHDHIRGMDGTVMGKEDHGDFYMYFVGCYNE